MDKEILYTIGEVSKILECNSSKIRFWLKQFPEFLTCVKTEGGQRRFRFEDYVRLKKVKMLIEDEKLTLDGVQKRLLIEKTKKQKLKLMMSTIIQDVKDGVSEEVLLDKITQAVI